MKTIQMASVLLMGAFLLLAVNIADGRPTENGPVVNKTADVTKTVVNKPGDLLSLVASVMLEKVLAVAAALKVNLDSLTDLLDLQILVDVLVGLMGGQQAGYTKVLNCSPSPCGGKPNATGPLIDVRILTKLLASLSVL